MIDVGSHAMSGGTYFALLDNTLYPGTVLKCIGASEKGVLLNLDTTLSRDSTTLYVYSSVQSGWTFNINKVIVEYTKTTDKTS